MTSGGRSVVDPRARGGQNPYHRPVERAGRPEAVVAVVMRGRRFLVIKRGAKVILPGYWAPPSGRIEPGETHEEALVRELEEELGVAATPVAKVWECPTHDDAFVLHWWTADIDACPIRPDPDEVADARWVTPEEFLGLEPTFEGDRYFFTGVLPTLSLVPPDAIEGSHGGRSSRVTRRSDAGDTR